jgi:hypothetical protein
VIIAASAVSDTLILADADALWPRMIRVCDDPVVLHAVLPQQNGADGRVKGHCIGALLHFPSLIADW